MDLQLVEHAGPSARCAVYAPCTITFRSPAAALACAIAAAIPSVTYVTSGRTCTSQAAPVTTLLPARGPVTPGTVLGTRRHPQPIRTGAAAAPAYRWPLTHHRPPETSTICAWLPQHARPKVGIAATMT